MNADLDRDYYFARSWLPQLLDPDEVLSLRSSPVSNIVALYKPAFEQTYQYGPYAKAVMNAANDFKLAWRAYNNEKRYELVLEFLYLGYRESKLHADAHKRLMQLSDIQYRVEFDTGLLSNNHTPGHPRIDVRTSDSILLTNFFELQTLVVSTWPFERACRKLKESEQANLLRLEETGNYFSSGLMLYLTSFLAQDILFANPSFKDIVFNLEQFAAATELELPELKTDSLVR
jgi:hypothetical protein